MHHQLKLTAVDSSRLPKLEDQRAIGRYRTKPGRQSPLQRPAQTGRQHNGRGYINQKQDAVELAGDKNRDNVMDYLPADYSGDEKGPAGSFAPGGQLE